MFLLRQHTILKEVAPQYCQHMNIYPFFPLLQLQCIVPTLLLLAMCLLWLKFYNDLKVPLNAFKTSLFFFYPARVCELKPTNIDIEDLQVFLFFTLLIWGNMKAGLPMCWSQAVGVSLRF